MFRPLFTAVVAAAVFAGAVAAAPAKLPQNLVGTWERNISAAKSAGFGGGVYKMRIRAAGRAVIVTPSAGSVTTTLSVRGNQMTFGRIPICPTSGRYKWRLSGRNLTLTASGDGCRGRVAIYAGVWKKP